jgi:16S rRNA (adenine1518-N6/adenine1519-N6)-dimethyltransferase
MLGQNFMVDSGQVQKIVDTAKIHATDTILEVGPGLGSLTLGLLGTNASVVAVELDKRLADLLPSTVERHAPEFADNLSVLSQDALELKPSSLDVTPTKLVANLPYNVGTQILLTVLSRFESVKSALVLVQAEVAERLCAAPGSKVYGIPSAKLNWFGSATIAGVVPRSAFFPVPRVDSKLVHFVRHTQPKSFTTGVHRDDVFSLINLGFSQRRKTLKSLLGQSGFDKIEVAEKLDSLQIDPLARAETLSIEQFATLSKILLTP